MAREKTLTVKLKTSMAGSVLDDSGEFRYHFTRQPGEVIQMQADEARRYVEAGYAEFVEKGTNQ